MASPAPDRTDAEYEKKGVGFRCNVEKTYDEEKAEHFDIATCLMPMPITEMIDFEIGEYRYSPLDENIIKQYGYVYDPPSEEGEDILDNRWVPLGTVKFQGAMDGVNMAIGAALAGIVIMTMF